MVYAWLILGVVWLVWLALVLNCLTRSGHWPVFKNPLFNRLFWLAALLLFNPILMLVYLVIGRKSPAWTRGRVAAALALVGIIIFLTEIPWHRWDGNQPVEWERPGAQSSSLWGINAHLGVNFSNIGSSTGYAQGGADSDFFSMRRVVLINHATDSFGRQLGSELARAVSNIPGIERVTYYPPGASLPNGKRLPDLTLTLDFPVRSAFRLPGFGRNRGQITLSAANDPLQTTGYSRNSDSPPVVSTQLTVHLNYEIREFGIETGIARGGKQIDEMVKDLAKSLETNLSDTAGKHPSMPEFPAVLYGTETPVRETPLAEAFKPALLISGPGMMIERHSVWSFRDDRPTTDALNAAADSLKREGWQNVNATMGEWRVRAEKENRHLEISRGPRLCDWMDDEEPTRSYLMHEIVPFSDARTSQALAALFESKLPPATLIPFIQISWKTRMQDRLFERLEQAQPEGAPEALQLSKAFRNRGKPVIARGFFDLARVLFLVSPERGSRDALEKYARDEFKIENLESVPIPNEIWSRVASPLPDREEAVAFDAGRSLRYFWLNDDGEPNIWSLLVTDHRASGTPNPSYVMTNASQNGFSSQQGELPEKSWEFRAQIHANHTRRGETDSPTWQFECASKDGKTWQGTVKPQAKPETGGGRK